MWKFIFLFLTWGVLLTAQEEIAQEEITQEAKPLWLFSQHPINEQKTYEEINYIIAEGYAIGGIEIHEGSLELLTYLAPTQIPKNWYFSEFLDLKEMESQLSAMMKEGWYLLDIAWGKDRIYTILEKRPEFVPLRWRMAAVDTIAEISPLYRQYQKLGYLFSAMSISPDGRFWLMFIQYEDSPVDTSLLQLHQLPGDEEGILYQLQEGRSPQAMMRANNQYYILYH